MRRRRRRKYRLRYGNIAILLAVLTTMVMGTVMLVTFKPSKTDAESAWVLYSNDNRNVHTSVATLAMRKANSTGFAFERLNAHSQRKAHSFTGSIESLNLNPSRFDAHARELNEYIYSMTKAIINYTEWGGLPERLKVPEMYLGLNFAEFSSVAVNEIPFGTTVNRYAFGSDYKNLTTEIIDNFSSVDSALLRKVLGATEYTRVSCKFPVGPFQMQSGYGSKNLPGGMISKLNLTSMTEYELVISSPDAYKATLEVPFTSEGNAEQNFPGDIGDRNNYNDSLIRTINNHRQSNLHPVLKQMMDENNNKYFNTAIFTTAHNVGASIYSNAPDVKQMLYVKSYGEPIYTPTSYAWEFCLWIAQPENIELIKEHARKTINEGNYMFRPSSGVLRELIEANGHLMDSEVFSFLNQKQEITHYGGMTHITERWNTEPQLHALVTLYHQVRLELLAAGE